MYIFYPFSILYASLVATIRFLYQFGLLKTRRCSVPVLKLGNLSVGGTGKTPHVEFIVESLAQSYNIVILSRGYNRKTKGIFWVKSESTAEEVGDEPLQLRRKFPHVPIIVSERRVRALAPIQEKYPQTNLIILDDAMQHWALEASCRILLSTFDRPFFRDYPLPLGRLREFRSGYKRAEYIIITKCPVNISEAEQESYRRNIKLLVHQQLYFSYYTYGFPYSIWDSKKEYTQSLRKCRLIVITAIATTRYLEHYLRSQTAKITWIKFKDHYFFTEKDIENLNLSYESNAQFSRLADAPTLVVTTEKDATRLRLHQGLIKKHALPIYVLPIKVRFVQAKAEEFLANLKETITSNGTSIR